MKRKLLFATLLVAGALGMRAQTDVTSTLLTNADFSSTDGWTATVSGEFRDYGTGLIGTYQVRGDKPAATVDETHLGTEYAFGFECRWEGNYSSYIQTTQTNLSEGTYYLTFDVENTNNATTSASYENRFTVKVGETTYTDKATEWMKGKSSWTTHTIEFRVDEAAKAEISFGYGTGSNNIGSANTPVLYVSHLKLTYLSYIDAAKNKLSDEIEKAEASEQAENLASAIADAKTALNDAAATEETLTSALQALQNEVYLYENGLSTASADNPILTKLVVNGTFDKGIEGWTSTGGFYSNKLASNQQGDFTVPFWENWDGSAKVDKMYQSIANIPNGTYKLKIAAFVQTLADDPNESQYVFANNDKVYLTTGEPTFYEVWTVVTNNQIEIGLEQTTETSQWLGIDNVTLTYYGAGDVIEAAKAEEADPLRQILNEAYELYATTQVPTVNIGTGAFQYQETLINAYNEAAVQYGTYTIAQLKAALTAKGKYNEEDLTAMLNEYKAIIAQLPILNAPKDGQLFNIINDSEGYNHRGKAVTFKSASNADLTENTTKIGYNEEPCSIYPQAVKFTAVEGVVNGYLLSYTRADGQEVFVGTGSSTGLGNNNDQLRPTTDPEKAVTIQVVATNNEGVWNLYNTAANKNIGANGADDQGFYTTAQFNSMNIHEALNMSHAFTINAETQYSTLIVPFDAEKPEDVEVFTVTALNENVLELTTASAIKANTPYVVKATAGANVELQGLGAAYTDETYTEGLLTGVYADTEAPVGSYVLQNQNGEEGEGVGFYEVQAVVGATDATTDITVPANKAYLTVPVESAEIKAFFFSDKEGDATAIAGLSVLLDGGYEAIYNAAGAKVNGLQKGLNVVKKGGKAYKIYVK